MAVRDSGSSGDSKRRRILDAALEVSQERGVHAARMEEVAARAQVSKGTLYRYFENKEDLFLEMIIDSYQLGHRARLALVGAQPKLGPAETLHHLLDGLAKVLDVVAPRSRVHFQAFGVVGDDPEASARLNQFLAGFHRDRLDEYEELIRAGQLEGVFRSETDPAVAAHIILSLLSGFIYRASFDPAAASPDALQGCFETIFTEILGFQPVARPSSEDADA
ncbi:MAG: TetR/AcrR family transcriptional regulator [Myxococcota bacterium]